MENDLLPSEGGVAIEPHGTKIIRVRLFKYPNMRIYKKGFRRMFYKIYLIQQNTTNIIIIIIIIIGFIGQFRKKSSQFNYQAILFRAKSNATEKRHSISFYD